MCLPTASPCCVREEDGSMEASVPVCMAVDYFARNALSPKCEKSSVVSRSSSSFKSSTTCFKSSYSAQWSVKLLHLFTLCQGLKMWCLVALTKLRYLSLRPASSALSLDWPHLQYCLSLYWVIPRTQRSSGSTNSSPSCSQSWMW